jgi:hypothetical protein
MCLGHMPMPSPMFPAADSQPLRWAHFTPTHTRDALALCPRSNYCFTYFVIQTHTAANASVVSLILCSFYPFVVWDTKIIYGLAND